MLVKIIINKVTSNSKIDKISIVNWIFLEDL